MKDRNDVTYRSLRKEREYGGYWYSFLWKIIRPILVGLTVAVIVTGILMMIWNKGYESFFAPPEAGNTEEIPFEISNGQSLTRVASNLEKAGLIRSRTVFKYYCDFAGMGQKLQVGSYRLNKGMSMTEVADKLTTGDGNPLVRNITLIPGETIEEFAAKLVKNGVLENDTAFLEMCKSGSGYRDFYYITDVWNSGTAAKRKYVLEGYLAPNTYEVYTSADEDTIIRKLLSQTESVFTEDSRVRADELGMSMDQVLTLASLIEKEAKTDDFAKVSAVFHNRLKKDMKLQSDVTIHYVTGVRKMALNSEDLAIDSPYNTYLYKGLPVGPVCNPSPNAIQAALYPDESYIAEKILYFCAKDPESGELYFSKTLEEHEQAMKIYAPLWKQYDESRGIK